MHRTIITATFRRSTINAGLQVQILGDQMQLMDRTSEATYIPSDAGRFSLDTERGR